MTYRSHCQGRRARADLRRSRRWRTILAFVSRRIDALAEMHDPLPLPEPHVHYDSDTQRITGSIPWRPVEPSPLPEIAPLPLETEFSWVEALKPKVEPLCGLIAPMIKVRGGRIEDGHHRALEVTRVGGTFLAEDADTGRRFWAKLDGAAVVEDPRPTTLVPLDGSPPIRITQEQSEELLANTVTIRCREIGKVLVADDAGEVREITLRDVGGRLCRHCGKPRSAHDDERRACPDNAMASSYWPEGEPGGG